MGKPDHNLLVEFVFELLKKHGEETLKAQQEERQRMVDNAEFIRDMERENVPVIRNVV